MKKKAFYRKQMIEQLKAMPMAERQRQTDLILDKLMASDSYKKAKSLALYMFQDFEFDLTRLFEDESKQILIPKTLPGRQMIFASYDKDSLTQSAFGIAEPNSNKAESPDLIIVPGLAWNKTSHRIGFGGGYYDRYLADFTGPTASVCYDFQVIDFEPESHDIPVNAIFSL
ncbi:5-formyltetrahydrofolate cyclo-ligase [Lactococcus termiticola]|uniref:5-formyltetrahydrofolate cyclo-ligase n=1 Tax=Lactococcus termiticola TaxID=2169526 RepID=A0A2R5HFP0_9LACT|nr:5-formyltetrahydrofolate cyclo-ligase [Lactococcus termiticola]GBG96844.1 5-formyltetrahydrofolate cyclo-ligase [Lactococcus termiticola]